MILATDVYYYETTAKSVGVLFEKWTDAAPSRIVSALVDNPLPYEPGRFYKRELPCLLALLQGLDMSEIELIIVDGYVFLDDSQKGGLGFHLYNWLNGAIPVIGVAKTSFMNNKANVIEVRRGASKTPLYISAIGLELMAAAAYIQQMHGSFRMPALLKLLDAQTRT